MPLDQDIEIVASACPHDCPSTCALEVERLDAHRIGRVRGAADNGYTDGVICAKVARYAERVHHPDRLMTPLRRVGDKGGGRQAFRPISWDDALDAVVAAFTGALWVAAPDAFRLPSDEERGRASMEGWMCVPAFLTPPA